MRVRLLLSFVVPLFLLGTGLRATRAATIPVSGIASEGPELLSVTLGGESFGQSRMVGGVLTVFRGASASVILVPHGAPAPPSGTRAGLVGDFLLDTGVINPAVGPATATASFPAPVVNRPGPDLVFLEINLGGVADAMQVTVNGVTLVVPGSAWGATGFTTGSADLHDTRNPGNTANQTVTTLAELEAAPLAGSNGEISQMVYGVGLDLSDFNLAPGASVPSVSFGSSGATFDPVLIAGLVDPPERAGGPVIWEFLAGNGEGIRDEDFDRHDWLELYNAHTNAVDLAGWRLSDDPLQPAKWVFPPRVMQPFDLLLVFASSKNRTATLPFHTNFKLAKGGGTLLLSKPDGTVVSSIVYGPQTDDVSFGFAGAALDSGYFETPTPGGANPANPSPGPPAAAPLFSHPGGVVTTNLLLEITHPSPVPVDAEIRYTLDTSEPTTASPLYSAPIAITASTTVRARVFQPGRLPSPMGNRHFLRLDASLAANYRGSGQPFQSNLPVLLLDSFGSNVDTATSPTGSRPYRVTQAAIYEPGTNGWASLASAPTLQKRGGTHVRGQSSAGFPQKAYAWELWEDHRDDDDGEPLLDMPAAADWALHAPWSDKSLIRNALAYSTLRDWAGPGSAPRGRLVEVFFNQTGAALDLADYRGVYLLVETIERGPDRVDVAGLNGFVTDPAALTGGYLFSKDKTPYTHYFTTTGSNAWGSQGLDLFEPSQPTAAQAEYMRLYLNGMESALSGPNFANPSLGYPAWLDAPSFMDYRLWTEMFRQVDINSTYFSKDRGGRVRALPIWDFNMSLGNTTDLDNGGSQQPGQQPAEGWCWVRLLDDWQSRFGPSFYPYYPRLFADPEFTTGYWDRYWALRRGIFSDAAIDARIDAFLLDLTAGSAAPVTNGTGAWSTGAPSVESPAGRHFLRWKNLGQNNWPNPTGVADRSTYSSETEFLRRWLKQRLAWMDQQGITALTLPLATGALPLPPETTPGGGGVAVNAPILLHNPNLAGGAVLYTLDGPDPRAPGGAPDPAALTASASQAMGQEWLGFGATWRSLAPASAPAANWVGENFDDSSWASVSSPREATQPGTVYFRTTVILADVNGVESVRGELLADDGAVVFVNGVEVFRAGVPYPPTPVTHTTPATALMDLGHEAELRVFTLPASALRAGTNTLAVEVHQYNFSANGVPASTDLSFDLRLRGITRAGGSPLAAGPAGARTLRARVRNGADWSPLLETVFLVGAEPPAPGEVVVSEFHYHPANPTPGEFAAGHTDADRFEFVEILNISNHTLDLTGARFTDGILFDFATAAPFARTLAPGARAVIAADAAAFAARYPSAPPLAGVYADQMGNGGETLTLSGATNQVLVSFTYSDLAPWPVEADGLGPSLVLNHPTSNPDPRLAANWRPSGTPAGAPGGADADPFPAQPHGDDDSDGRANLLEYALQPGQSVEATLVSHTPPLGAPGDYLQVRARRNLLADGFSLEPERSANLRDWEAGAFDYLGCLRHPDATATLTWRSRHPAGPGPDYVRLRVAE